MEEAKALICELCAEYYKQGWVSGTGGGMSIKVADGSGTIVMAPSGLVNHPQSKMQLPRTHKLRIPYCSAGTRSKASDPTGSTFHLSV